MRLFVACNLPDAVRVRLWEAAAPLRASALPVRWSGQDALHVTVKFLGEVEAARVEEVRNALAGAGAGAQPFEVSLAGLGAFPNLRHARVVWVGAAAPDALHQVYDRTERALAPLGFAREERPFHPHVTLGRVGVDATTAQLADLANLAAHFDFSARVMVHTLDLMRSHLGSAGARYECIAALPLGGGGGIGGSDVVA